MDHDAHQGTGDYPAALGRSRRRFCTILPAQCGRVSTGLMRHRPYLAGTVLSFAR